MADRSWVRAEDVHIMQGRATVLHAFDAQGPEELSAYAGEQVIFLPAPLF